MTQQLMTPYPDQQLAIDKLRKVAARLIGDEMGIGKTVTGAYLDFALREDNPDLADTPTLVICEKIGLDVWDYHLQACGVPKKEILLIDPKDRDRFANEVGKLQNKRRVRGHKFVHPRYRYFVMHWDALAKVEEVNARPTIKWSHVIADEVHLAKNRNAIRTKELRKTKTHFKTGLTGNPADDKPMDMWAILNWLYPREYSSYWAFHNRYTNWVYSSQIQEYREHIDNGGTFDDFVPEEDGYGYKVTVGVKNIDELLQRIDPFYIRRLLDEVEDMPPKVHVRPITTVQLTASQRKAYDSMEEEALAVIGGAGSDGFVLLAPAKIAVLTRLQQFALGSLVPEWEIPEGEWIDDEDSIDWEFPKIVLSKPSSKLDAVMNYLETHSEQPFVIFSQFRGMVDLIEDECKRKGISVVKITGAVTDKDERTRRVEAFQQGQARVFVGTIAAAGKTITLTRAHHVIFTDRAWNPSKNEQAEARLWRRTQKNAVRVIDIQAENTVDQWRADKIAEKGRLVKLTMGDTRRA